VADWHGKKHFTHYRYDANFLYPRSYVSVDVQYPEVMLLTPGTLSKILPSKKAFDSCEFERMTV